MILAIYGSGGLGREVFDLASRRNAVSNLWSEIVFINDFIDEGNVYGTQVIHFETLLKSKDDYEVVIAVGEPSSREKLYQKLMDNEIKSVALIDPTAVVSPSAIIEDGTIVGEYSTIHCNVKIGRNCLIQPYCCLGHDIQIGNHTVLSAYFSPGGGSVFGDKVYCGMHSIVKEKLTIGDSAVVAMGAVVFNDVASHSVVIGNPARVTRGNDDGKVFR